MRVTIFVAALSSLLVACGGGGGKDPILGTPTVTSAPRVISTTPAKRTPIVTGVATNSMLIAKFSRDMLASTVNVTSFTVACPAGTPVIGTVTYDAASRIAKLKPTSDLTPSTTCEARVTTTAKDTAGIALAADYVWRFTTGTGPDNTPHAVITTRSPADGATGVCLSKTVSVTFDEPMDPTSINATTFFVKDSNSVLVPGAISYDMASNTATFAVTNPPGFTASTIYTSTVTTGATDLAGNPTSNSNATFTTGTLACAPMTSVALGTIAPFGAFGGGAGTTNSGINTVVEGDLGTTAACTLFTGFHDGANVYTETPLNIGEVTGDIFCGPPAPGTTQKLAIATQAAADALTAYNALGAMAVTGTLTSGDLNDVLLRKLAPGVYTPAAATLQLSAGNFTLDAGGNADAVWVFQIPESLTMAAGTQVLLANGAKASNVYWKVGSAARLENRSTMVGTIIARAGVTISTAGELQQTTLTGRAIGLDASVTMVNTTIVAP